MASTLSSSVALAERADTGERGIARALPLVGRALFSVIFLMAGPAHFAPGTIQYAAAQGVPLAPLLVPASGLLALAGGLSILMGYHARIGAGLLALFLVPVTVTMHAFWAVGDPMLAQMQQAMFFKNLALLGGALLIAYFGSGPLSLSGGPPARPARRLAGS